MFSCTMEKGYRIGRDIREGDPPEYKQVCNGDSRDVERDVNRSLRRLGNMVGMNK